MHIVFFSTSDVFKAEERLITNDIECKVVPTPVQDKAYCGVCVVTSVASAVELLTDMEYELIE